MIKINGKSYDAQVVVALDGSMSLTFEGTTKTIGEIEALLNTSPKIEVYEGEDVIATYYSKQMVSLSAKKTDDTFTITVVLRASKVEPNAETILQTEINAVKNNISDIETNATETEETLSGAIEDLATIVSEIVANNVNAETVTEESNG